MTPTSVSLLDRLKDAPPDASDWGRLQDIYLPLITRWLRRIPGLGDDSDDLAQEVFVVMVRELPRFERQREGSFRVWLRQVTVNKVRTFRKRLGRKPVAGMDLTDGFLDRLAEPNSELARVGPGPRPARLPKAAGNRAAGFPTEYLGSLPPVRHRRPPGRRSRRPTGAQRQFCSSGQVACSQEATGGSRRASGLISIPFVLAQVIASCNLGCV